MVFATPTKTKKFKHIAKFPNVSLLIDNRTEFPDNLNKIAALTANGTAKQLKTDLYRNMLLKKHPNLEKFVSAPDSTLIVVNNLKYSYVTNFQQVFEWIPDKQ
jgi:hypothetical protein